MPDVTPPCSACEKPAAQRKVPWGPQPQYCGTAECRNARWLARHHERKHDPEYRAARRRIAVGADRRWREKNRERARAALAQWRSDNRERIAEQYRQWRIANANVVRAKNNRRRARLLEAFVADVDPQAIWDRDGGICQLCGDPIDPALPWPEPMSKTLDHVVPLSTGGTHEPANVQLAHALCNCIKGNR